MGDEFATLYKTLKDAGFRESEIKEFIEIYQNDTIDKQCECLQRKRKKLLDKVHQEEACIQCLDYLKFQIDRKGDE